MAAFQQVRSGEKVRVGRASKRSLQSPIDRANGVEIVWNQVRELFQIARIIANPTFVYFIGEENDGPVKIGVAKDPVKRVRQMQTGNPRRLRVEHVLIGDRDSEQLLHEIWEEFAIYSATRQGKPDVNPGTEWFRAEIREALFPVVETAVRHQVAFLKTTPGNLAVEDLERLIRQAHGEHDVTLKKRDEVRLLGVGAGYVVKRRSRI